MSTKPGNVLSFELSSLKIKGFFNEFLVIFPK